MDEECEGEEEMTPEKLKHLVRQCDNAIITDDYKDALLEAEAIGRAEAAQPANADQKLKEPFTVEFEDRQCVHRICFHGELVELGGMDTLLAFKCADVAADFCRAMNHFHKETP
jgi:hypothetical protein